MESTKGHNINELLSRVAEGDQSAFRQLVFIYSDKVFFHALTFVKTWHQAEEVAQDIFLHIWEKREKLTQVQQFDNYLFIVSKNFLISFMRKKVRDFKTLEESDEFTPSAATQYELKETGSLLQKAIRQLPDQKRRVFELIHLDGLSQEEVARQLGIATRTVRWNLVSAINGIRDFLIRHDTFLLLLALNFF